MKLEKSCGAVCFTEQNGEIRVLMVRHRAGGHWAFPKGHVEGSESEEQTAEREVLEETGIRIRILSECRQTNSYSPCPGTQKTVVFFSALRDGGKLQPQKEEVTDAEFLSLDRARQVLTYAADRRIMENALPAAQKALGLPPQANG